MDSTPNSYQLSIEGDQAAEISALTICHDRCIPHLSWLHAPEPKGLRVVQISSGVAEVRARIATSNRLAVEVRGREVGIHHGVEPHRPLHVLRIPSRRIAEVEVRGREVEIRRRGVEMQQESSRPLQSVRVSSRVAEVRATTAAANRLAVQRREVEIHRRGVEMQQESSRPQSVRVSSRVAEVRATTAAANRLAVQVHRREVEIRRRGVETSRLQQESSGPLHAVRVSSRVAEKTVEEEDDEFTEAYVNERDPSILHFLLASGDE
ncbi:hypothetical protein R1flu_023931 [Riccia fluitans]|uniref:Uncharacterized protein n=1 Tax=Riccia fluitans TaxID=41844 RepID=A0ABD1XTX0_9MARC